MKKSSSIIISVVLLILISFLIITNVKIKSQRQRLLSQIDSIKNEIKVLEEKGKELTDQALRSGSKEYLEQVAREQFNLKAPGEDVIVITKDEEKTEPEKKTFWQRIISIFRRD